MIFLTALGAAQMSPSSVSMPTKISKGFYFLLVNSEKTIISKQKKENYPYLVVIKLPRGSGRWERRSDRRKKGYWDPGDLQASEFTVL